MAMVTSIVIWRSSLRRFRLYFSRSTNFWYDRYSFQVFDKSKVVLSLSVMHVFWLQTSVGLDSMKAS